MVVFAIARVILLMSFLASEVSEEARVLTACLALLELQEVHTVPYISELDVTRGERMCRSLRFTASHTFPLAGYSNVQS